MRHRKANRKKTKKRTWIWQRFSVAVLAGMHEGFLAFAEEVEQSGDCMAIGYGRPSSFTELTKGKRFSLFLDNPKVSRRHTLEREVSFVEACGTAIVEIPPDMVLVDEPDVVCVGQVNVMFPDNVSREALAGHILDKVALFVAPDGMTERITVVADGKTYDFLLVEQ